MSLKCRPLGIGAAVFGELLVGLVSWLLGLILEADDHRRHRAG